jgi:hypothetical protein
MAKAAEKQAPARDRTAPTPSKTMVRGYASNEFVFAVVGHVGSGTTKIANSLAELLNQGSIAGGPFDTEIIKARELIEAWATENRKAIPASEPRNLHTTEQFQNLGDEMRADGDHAAVANRAIQRIRLIRAQKQKMEDPGDKPVEPDGSRRAYIIDSIRHPAEVELLRRVYREAFVLIGVVCDAEVRLTRLQSEKYSSASKVSRKRRLWPASFRRLPYGRLFRRQHSPTTSGRWDWQSRMGHKREFISANQNYHSH